MSGRRSVVIPYVRGQLLPETNLAVQFQVRGRRLERIAEHDPTDYVRLLLHLWAGAGELVLVGQSVLPPRDAIHRLLDCSRPWCTHQVELQGQLRADTLGLCKFSGALRLQTLQLLRDRLTPSTEGGSWATMREAASRVHRALLDRGHEPHLHQPPAQSLQRGELVPTMTGAN